MSCSKRPADHGEYRDLAAWYAFDMSRLRVLALASYPDRAAATRFRIVGYRRLLADLGIDVSVHSVLDDAQFARFYRPGGRLDKAACILAGTGRQLAALASRNVDVVFVQREATLVGPAFIEWLATRFRGLPLVYDLDDAVWMLPESLSSDGRSLSRHPLAARLFRRPEKTWSILRLATHIVAGSKYLAEVSSRYNSNVTVLPTVVSREEWKPLPGRLDGMLVSGAPAPVIGWIGTHTTAPMLEVVGHALHRLRAAGHRFIVRLIGAGDFSIPGLDCEALPWRREHEMRDFQEIDIGIAPLLPVEFSKGKCAFKQLEYMAVGVPCVSSADGGALDFMVQGENGLLARTHDDWFDSLRALLEDRALRARIAKNGRELVERSHSTEAQAPKLAEVLWRAARSGPPPRAQTVSERRNL